MLGDGLALPEDAEYWRPLAAGGAAMVTVGGTVTAPESTWRRRIVTEAWREEGIPGLALRAQAIRSEGAVAACQLVHLGRETTGAEMWYAPVAPSAVRSPREPTRPRALSEADIDGLVEGFRVCTVHAAQAGFQVVELHAAHGYLLAQFLSPLTNLRPGADSDAKRTDIVSRIAEAIRRSVPEVILGIPSKRRSPPELTLSASPGRSSRIRTSRPRSSLDATRRSVRVCPATKTAAFSIRFSCAR